MKKVLLAVACLSLLAIVPGCRKDKDNYDNGKKRYTKETTYKKSTKQTQKSEPMRKRQPKEFAEERPMRTRPMTSSEAY
ncbi:MAG TPA: hypothetical protein VGT41_03230 [Candidatus Babeliales bacterium]|nr:hypothetical protein [Candidatus Babeliales bacterium]